MYGRGQGRRWIYTVGRGELAIDYVMEDKTVMGQVESMKIGDNVDYYPLIIRIKATREERRKGKGGWKKLGWKGEERVLRRSWGR